MPSTGSMKRSRRRGRTLGGVRGPALRHKRSSFRPRPETGESMPAPGCADFLLNLTAKWAAAIPVLPADRGSLARIESHAYQIAAPQPRQRSTSPEFALAPDRSRPQPLAGNETHHRFEGFASLAACKHRFIYSLTRRGSSKSELPVGVLHNKTMPAKRAALICLLSSTCNATKANTTIILSRGLLACYTLQNEIAVLPGVGWVRRAVRGVQLV